MRRHKIQQLPKKLFEKTTKRLNDSDLKFSLASKILVNCFASIPEIENVDGRRSYEGIKMRFNDEKFYDKKNLINRSKTLKTSVEERGIEMIIQNGIEDEEFVAKLQNLPGVRSFAGAMIHGLSGASLLEVRRTCRDL